MITSPDNIVYVGNGSDQTFTFWANEGYELYQLWVDDELMDEEYIIAGSYTFTKVIANHTIFIKCRLADYYGGDGSEEDPILICTEEQLAKLATDVNTGNNWSANKWFVLMENLDFENFEYADAVGKWTPIGTNNQLFQGNFDGNRHIVKNLTINRSGADFIGLFFATNDATISNLGIEDCNISGKDNTGALIGNLSNNSAIENCYATGTVTGTGNNTGGLVGASSNNSTITNSYAAVTVTGTTDYIGGLTGSNYIDCNINNCYATGTVSGGSYVGGLVGSNDQRSVVANCYATGTVTGANNIGGLAGWNQNSATIRNSVAANNAISGTSNRSRVVGWLTGGILTNNYANEAMTVNGSMVTDGTTSNTNGADKSLYELKSFDFYNANTGNVWLSNTPWSIAKEVDPEKIWNICDGATFPFFQWEAPKECLDVYTITVTAEPEEGGTVTGGGIYVENTTVTLAATPEECYELVNWTTEADEFFSTDNPLIFPSISNLSLVAHFEIITYTITTSAGENGNINPAPTAMVNCDADQMFTITPDLCFEIDELWVNEVAAIPDSVIHRVGYYTFHNVKSEQSIDVTFKPFAYNLPREESICTGDSLEFYGSYIKTEDVYYHTITIDSGCDSVYVTLTLTVHLQDTTDLPISICIGKEYKFFENIYDEAGTYYHTLKNIYECDSVIKLILTVDEYIPKDIFKDICEGDTYDFYGEEVFETNVYQTIVPSANPAYCDTLATLTLTVHLVYTTPVFETICGADTFYEFYDQILTETGIYTHTLTTVHSCDSIIELHLTVKPTCNFYITAIAGSHGWIAPDGVTEVEPGEDQPYTFGSDTGYEVNQLLIDGVNQPAFISGGTYTFNNVDDNHTIVVTFRSLTATTCPEHLYDVANDILYNIVELSGLCWIKENLRNTQYQDGSTVPFANPYNHPLYPDVTLNTKRFGLLYNYSSALPEDSRALCPNGWRLPTTNEWLLLNQHNINDLRNPEYWFQPNNNTNTLGFDSRGAGYYNSAAQRFENLYGYTAYWSSDTPAPTTAACATIHYYCNQIEIIEIQKTDAVSVRCVMD